MKLRSLALAGAAALAAFAFSACAEPPHGHGGPAAGVWQEDWNGHGDRDWHDAKGGWHQDHDRYWRDQYHDRGFVDADKIFRILRGRHYTQFEGRPFWFHGRYIVRSYDRRGNVVMIEVNPYTGAYIGILD